VVEQQARQAQRLAEQAVAEGGQRLARGVDAAKVQAGRSRQALRQVGAEGVRQASRGLDQAKGLATRQAQQTQHSLAQGQQRISQGVAAATSAAERAVTEGRRVVGAAIDAGEDVARESPPLRAVGAIVRDSPPTEKADHQTVNLNVVDARVHQIENDLDRGMTFATRSGDSEAAMGVWPAQFGAWVGRVWPGQAWDDKAHVPKDQRSKLETQGNFSYGATAAALGLPKIISQYGAGGAQRILTNPKYSWNNKGAPPPSLARTAFDAPIDYEAANAGYDYFRTGDPGVIPVDRKPAPPQGPRAENPAEAWRQRAGDHLGAAKTVAGSYARKALGGVRVHGRDAVNAWRSIYPLRPSTRGGPYPED
jgi:hypothetical protein